MPRSAETALDHEPTVGRHDRRVFVFVAALTFVGLVVLALFYGSERDYWLIAIPTYLTGVGTLGLGWFAYRTMFVEAADRRRLQEQADVERRRADGFQQAEAARVRAEARARQAGLISAWPSMTRFDPRFVKTRESGGVIAEGAMIPAAIIYNASRAPIRQIQVDWMDARPGVAHVQKPLATRVFALAHPEPHSSSQKPAELLADWPDEVLGIALTFTDAAGVRWRLDQLGNLRELAE